MSLSLHCRRSRMPNLHRQDRDWFVLFFWQTGILDTVDISEIMEMPEAEVCVVLDQERERSR